MFLLVTHLEDHVLRRYGAIIDLTRKLNSKYMQPKQTQAETKRILKSLFPRWLPGAFSVSSCVICCFPSDLSPGVLQDSLLNDLQN